MKRTVEISHQINVTPEQAWKIIGAVGGVDKWFNSMIKSCRIEDGKRFCETADGIKLEEHILEVNHETRTFRFGIPKQDLLPVENIVEVMQVKEGEAGKTRVNWSATFEATEDNARVASDAFKNLWIAGLNEMEAYILAQPAEHEVVV